MSIRCLPLLLVVVCLQAFAHSEKESADAGLVDCEHPPENLAHVLPESIGVAAALICTPSAQMIVAGDGWAWRFPGSFFDRPSIPAFAPIESRSEAGGRYFVDFHTTELSSGEINQLHQLFVKTLVTYPDATPPARVVKLVARNDRGRPMDAYFGFRSPSEGWVALCAPECAPEMFFLMNRHD
ncbi:MAG: hypothetical protein ABI648_13385 [Betaproteobacteria bacterium]